MINYIFPSVSAGLASDLDGDGNVDFADYAKLADAWLEKLFWP